MKTIDLVKLTNAATLAAEQVASLLSVSLNKVYIGGSLALVLQDVINRDVRINENLFFFSLERSSREWADKIESSISNHLKEEGFNNIFKSIYNINESARKLREIYEREK